MAIVKTKKKLGLARETLRRLARNELGLVVAGSGFNSTCMGEVGSSCCPNPDRI